MTNKTLTLKKTIVDAEAAGFSPDVEVTRIEAVPADEVIAEANRVIPYTADQLRAMLAELEPTPTRIVTDLTMDLPTVPTSPEELAAKANLPPPDERGSGPVQVQAAVHGKFGLNGIPLIAPQVNLNETINPATGLPYIQVGIRPKTQISPPPSRNFR